MLSRPIALACLATVCAMPLGVRARDVGQFTHAPQHLKDWFNGLKAPKSGTLCCAEADGRRTEFVVRDGTYWVPIDGTWYAIPSDAVVRGSGNPTGEAIVFYYLMWDFESGGQRPVILCFVPNDFS